MANHQKTIGAQRRRRRFHVRNRARGTASQPRLSVDRSLVHIGAQLIDDQNGRTLVAVSSRDKDLRDSLSYGGNRDAASAIGKALAEKALAAGIERARFDRGHAKYHGRVAALADAAREAGLKF